MKQRHGINFTAITSINNLNGGTSDVEEFLVKPKLAVGKGAQPEHPAPSTTVASSYMPDQIESIPIKAVFSTNVK